MSAKKKQATKKAASGPSFIYLICAAIKAIKGGRKGVSRVAIANFLISNNNKTPGGQFNANLLRALKKGIASGILKYGESQQRFKLDENAKSIINPPKPKPKKKKTPKKSTKNKSTKKKGTKKKTPKKKTTKKKKKKK
eukprot:535979_1